MSNSRWIPAFFVLLAALTLAAAGMLMTTISVLLLIAAGLLFGIFLNRLSYGIALYTPIPYRGAYALVVVLLVVVVTAGASYLGSHVIRHLSQLTDELMAASRQLTTTLEDSKGAESFPGLLAELQASVTSGEGVLPGLKIGAQWLIGALTGLLVIFFVGLYVAYDPHLYETGLVRLVPPASRPRATEVLKPCPPGL